MRDLLLDESDTLQQEFVSDIMDSYFSVLLPGRVNARGIELLQHLYRRRLEGWSVMVVLGELHGG